MIFSILLLICMGKCLAKSHSDLTTDIMNGYQSNIRPSTIYNKTVPIYFKLNFNELLDVNEVSQKIETKLFISHIWQEPRLTWEPEDYGGIESVHIPSSDLWFPLLVLYNNADGDFAISQFTKAKVNYSGWVEWKPPVIFKSFCEIQVSDFPFDTQNCTMKIGPWSDHQNLIDMVNSDGYVKNHVCEDPDLSLYETNGEWKILSVGCYKHYVKYACCTGGKFIDFTYHFIIQRRPLYLSVNILFPTILFSFLTCAVFYVPSDAGEKVTVSISLLLSLIVFLLVIVEAVPSTANGVPLLCQYITFTMFLVCLSIMISVVVLNVHFRGPATHIMTDRNKKIFMTWLPKYIFSSTMRRIDPIDNESNDSTACDEVTELSKQQPDTQRDRLVGNDVRQATNGVNFVSEYFKDQRQSQKKEDEWKYVAMVLDHFLLYIFVIACLLGTIAVFGRRLVEYGKEEELFRNNKNQCLLGCKSSTV